MFGLSVAKIALLVAVVVAVIYGSRLLRSLGRSGDAVADEKRGAVDDGGAGDQPRTLEPCPRCGTYTDLDTHRCEA